MTTVQESTADAVKPARRESMQKLVPFVIETSYSLKKNLASGGFRTGEGPRGKSLLFEFRILPLN